jgi:hypothetical protein
MLDSCFYSINKQPTTWWHKPTCDHCSHHDGHRARPRHRCRNVSKIFASEFSQSSSLACSLGLFWALVCGTWSGCPPCVRNVPSDSQDAALGPCWQPRACTELWRLGPYTMWEANKHSHPKYRPSLRLTVRPTSCCFIFLLSSGLLIEAEFQCFDTSPHCEHDREDLIMGERVQKR